MNLPQVCCRHCEKPIRRRRDLYALGRTFIPVHGDCLRAYRAQLPWFLRGLPMNRMSSFMVVNAGTLLLIGVVAVVRPETPLVGVAFLLLVANVWLLLGRAACYIALERYIPVDADPPSGERLRG